MNFITVLFGLASILLPVQKISAREVAARTYRNKYDEPLGLIQQNSSLKLSLAIPYRLDGPTYAADYSYEDTTETFKIACPAFTKEQIKIEKSWRKKAHASDKSLLYFLIDYSPANWKMRCQRNERSGPSIKKTDRECGHSEGDIYEVGYPVSKDDEGTNIQFIAIYEICYSKDKRNGTIYTNHRIDSPSLLLLKVHDFYEPSMSETFLSPLDEKFEKVKTFYENKYIFQFVPRYDMPTMHWENTTLFPFNYTSIGQSQTMLGNMMKYDNVVRLFSRRTNQPLTFYSGAYQTAIPKQVAGHFHRTHDVQVPINSFWRVIIDDENSATILITQHTKMTCGIETSYMCDENVLLILEKYSDGGCTYQCPLSPALIHTLRLPELNIEGNLAFEYTVVANPKSETGSQGVAGQSYTDVESGSTQVSITEFGDGVGFAVALMAADASASQMMEAEGSFDSGNGHGSSDTGDGGGDNGAGSSGGAEYGGTDAGQ